LPAQLSRGSTNRPKTVKLSFGMRIIDQTTWCAGRVNAMPRAMLPVTVPSLGTRPMTCWKPGRTFRANTTGFRAVSPERWSTANSGKRLPLQQRRHLLNRRNRKRSGDGSAYLNRHRNRLPLKPKRRQCRDRNRVPITSKRRRRHLVLRQRMLKLRRRL